MSGDKQRSDKQRNELREYLERFDALPDDAIIPARITKAILPLSERTIRYHPDLPRIHQQKTLWL